MSIEDLKSRLQTYTENANTHTSYSKFLEPKHLKKALQIVEQKIEDLETGETNSSKIYRTISRFNESGFSQFTRRDWKNITWGLSKIFPDMQEKLIAQDLGGKVLSHLQRADLELISIVYFPLLYSYFALDKNEKAEQKEKWIQIREILIFKKSDILKLSKGSKKWMHTLVDHAEILSDNPTREFVQRFIENEDTTLIQEELSSLKIAAHSWFWDDLIEASIKAIQNMNQTEYFNKIARFIKLAEKQHLYTTDILIALLQRYEKTTERHKPHEELKNLALNHWGNPQYDSSAGWRNVNAETKKMVVQWFVRADLEAFFTLFSSTADTNRFNYWIKFIDQISFSQIFLGLGSLRSQQQQHKEFRSKNQGRLKELTGSTNSNNAFLLKINNIYVVDFSDTGNACYAYSKLPYNDIGVEVKVSDLKNKNIVLFRGKTGERIALSHQGDWVTKFDEQLNRLGISVKEKKLNNRSYYSR